MKTQLIRGSEEIDVSDYEPYEEYHYITFNVFEPDTTSVSLTIEESLTITGKIYSVIGFSDEWPYQVSAREKDDVGIIEINNASANGMNYAVTITGAKTGSGSLIISITDGEMLDGELPVDVRVNKGVESISLSSTSLSLEIGESQILTAEIQPAAFASLPYTGERITQTIRLTHPSFGELKEGTDYASPVYTNNLNAGTATVSIKGLGGFIGTLKKTFKITKLDLSKAEITIGTAFHTKGGAKPSVSVSLGGKTLIRDTDYTVSYKNNGKQTSSASASATIKGKGNYQGTQTKSFMISAKSLTAESGLKLVAADKAATGKKNGWSQSFKVYDTDGKVLAAKKDYDNASYSIVSGMLNGESVSAETALTKDDIVGAGSVIRISVDGKGDYAGGTLSGTYRILAAGCDISKATFRINDQVYPGKGGSVSIISAAQIGKAELKQGSGTTSLAFGSDFEVVEGSLENNRKTGTAKVTFIGMGKYGGTKTVSFKITAKMASD